MTHPNMGRGDVMLDFSEQARSEGRFFFYVRIHEDLGPMQRAERYEDGLVQALETAEIGEVTGGGSQLGEGDTVAFCGIDVVVDDRDVGLVLIKATLRELSCARSTVVEEYLPEYAEHPVWELD